MQLQIAGTVTVRSSAKVAMCGLSRFYTGFPCKAGHIAERYVSNRQCVTCNGIKARQREALRGIRDPSYRMYRNTLRRTGMALKGAASPTQALGCNHPKLRDHIAAQFRTGMSWERYRQWEVDHIEPLSAAKTLGDQIALSHYINLQPLWRSENLRKGGA